MDGLLGALQSVHGAKQGYLVLPFPSLLLLLLPVLVCRSDISTVAEKRELDKEVQILLTFSTLAQSLCKVCELVKLSPNNPLKHFV